MLILTLKRCEFIQLTAYYTERAQKKILTQNQCVSLVAHNTFTQFFSWRTIRIFFCDR